MAFRLDGDEGCCQSKREKVIVKSEEGSSLFEQAPHSDYKVPSSDRTLDHG